MFKKLINLYKVFKNKRYLYLYMEKDINVFLEESCGFKNKQSNKVTDIINGKNIVIETIDKKINNETELYSEYQKYNLEDNNNNYFDNYFDNYNLMQEIMKKIIFNDEFYLYNNNISLFENNQNNIKKHLSEVDKILQDNLVNYIKEMGKLKVNIDLLKDKLEKSQDILKNNEEKQYNLKMELRNKIEYKKKKLNILTPYENISLQDDMDKIEKDLKLINNQIKKIPIINVDIKKNIENNDNKITHTKNIISILKSFPIKCYKSFLKNKIQKIEIENHKQKKYLETIKNIKKISFLFQTYLFVHLIFSESFLFQINLLTILFFYIYIYILT